MCQPLRWSTSTSTWWPVTENRYNVVYHEFYWSSPLSRAKGHELEHPGHVMAAVIRLLAEFSLAGGHKERKAKIMSILHTVASRGRKKVETRKSVRVLEEASS
jgi:hypothetical protein